MHQARIMRRAFRATRRSANAAIQGAKTAEKSLTLLERDRLQISFPHTLDPSYGNTLIIPYVIINTGNTLGTIKQIEISVSKEAALPNFDTTTIHQRDVANIPVSPTLPAEFAYEISMSGNEAVAVKSDTCKVVLYGFIRYVDIFDTFQTTFFYRVYDPRTI